MINASFKTMHRWQFHFFFLKRKLKIEQLTTNKTPAVAKVMYTTESGIALVTVIETGMPSVGIPSVMNKEDQRKRG